MHGTFGLVTYWSHTSIISQCYLWSVTIFIFFLSFKIQRELRKKGKPRANHALLTVRTHFAIKNWYCSQMSLQIQKIILNTAIESKIKFVFGSQLGTFWFKMLSWIITGITKIRFMISCGIKFTAPGQSKQNWQCLIIIQRLIGGFVGFILGPLSEENPATEVAQQFKKYFKRTFGEIIRDFFCDHECETNSN